MIEQDNRLAATTAAIMGSVVGAHLLGALENLPEWMTYRSFWQYLYGNKTVLGGLLGGLLFVEAAKKLVGEKQHTGDLYTFPLILGMMIGRLGCFSMGIYEQTYGLTTRMPWGINLGDGLYRHPVALYEVLALAVLWLWLAIIRKKYMLVQGALFKIFMIAYCFFRLMLDVIKPGWRFLAGMGTIQFASLAGLLYYRKYIINPRLLIQPYAR